MKRILLLVLLSLVAIATAALASGTHAPILILGNSDFTSSNGVVGGTGGPDDPYIISGWEINVNQDVNYAVKIENTTANFILRGIMIRGATASDGAAIHLGFVSGAAVESCLISDSRNGIEIASSTDVTLTGNVLYIQGIGLRVTGETAQEYNLEIDETNELNNNPIRYIYGKDGDTISGISSNNLYLAACTNMTVTNNNIVNGDGIQLAFVDDSIICNNEVYRTSPVLTEHGIRMYRSDNNSVTDNVLQNNRLAGLYMWLSSNNQIVNNQLLANDTGLIIAASDGNQISANTAFANLTAIELRAGSTENTVSANIITHANTKYGVLLDQATHNLLEANAITDAETGIRLDENGNNNRVVSNTIVNAAYALSISGSNNDIHKNLISRNTRAIIFPETYGKVTVRGNAIHDNVFSDNSNHIYLNNDSHSNTVYANTFLGGARMLVEDYGKNTWTVNGQGNYWHDYQGEDANGDGIGDEPVFIYPAAVSDKAPITSLERAYNNLGILSTLKVDGLVLSLSDGTDVTLPALYADTASSRFVGFRGYPPALIDKAPGILFYYDDEATRRFTMATVPFELDIIFFDASGMFAGSMTMEAHSEDLYTAKSAFKYALELQAGKASELGIGEGSQLSAPLRGEE
jgi:parallel beta-helix repeat protein